MFDAKVAIISLDFPYSEKILSNVAPTVFSDIVCPGRSAFVESHNNASTPLRPISANRGKSIASPNTGV